MKEDILEQLVEDWLVSQPGWFVKHNVKYRPSDDSKDYDVKRDSVHSDIVFNPNPQFVSPAGEFVAEKMFLSTPAADEALYRLQQGFNDASSGKVPKCTLIAGPSGVGKTQVAKWFVSRHPHRQAADGRDFPVVYCPMNANSSVNDLTVSLLEAMDVSVPYSARHTAKRRLLKKSIKNLGVKMIVFDESQQIIEHRTNQVRYKFVDELKRLVDDLAIAIVLVGIVNQRRKLTRFQRPILTRSVNAFAVLPEQSRLLAAPRHTSS